ncbi:hypothetical protein, partial [Pseudomonas lundensis]|uniref:hypothetical protein n=1 Tax=Pseudomonas lundensis TaxID=86185 RepID=UPI0012FA5639
MNGITHLNLYPTLNMVAVKGAVSVFNSAVANNAFAALPGLHERVMRAQLLINSHSRSLVDQAIALEASLSSAGISDLAGQYKVIAEDSSLAPRLKAKGIEDLNAFCQERLRHVVQKAEAAQGLIEANRAEIGALTLDHFAGDLIDYGRSQGASATPHVRCCHVYPIQPPEYRGARHHYGDALSTTDAA